MIYNSQAPVYVTTVIQIQAVWDPLPEIDTVKWYMAQEEPKRNNLTNIIPAKSSWP